MTSFSRSRIGIVNVMEVEYMSEGGNLLVSCKGKVQMYLKKKGKRAKAVQCCNESIISVLVWRGK